MTEPTPPPPARRQVLRDLTREAVDAGSYGEPARSDADQATGALAFAIAHARIRGDGPWDTAVTVQKALGDAGYTVVPCASRAPGAAPTPGGDAGADRDGTEPAQAISAPPCDVPPALMDIAREAETAYDQNARLWSWEENRRHILTAVIREQVADEIARFYGPLDPDDDGDQMISMVFNHLRGLCTICGRAPDADPCGQAHAINLRGES